MLVDSMDEYEWSSWQEYNGTVHQGFCSTQVVLGRIPFADLKVLVETPLAEEDANHSLMSMLVPRSQRIQMKRYGNFSQPSVEQAMPPSFRHFRVHSRSFTSLQSMRKALDHVPSHISQAFHTPWFKGRQAIPSVMAAWYVSLFLVTMNMRPTLMIRNMRSTQNINIRCGSAEPVPLPPKRSLCNLPAYQAAIA